MTDEHKDTERRRERRREWVDEILTVIESQVGEITTEGNGRYNAVEEGAAKLAELEGATTESSESVTFEDECKQDAPNAIELLKMPKKQRDEAIRKSAKAMGGVEAELFDYFDDDPTPPPDLEEAVREGLSGYRCCDDPCVVSGEFIDIISSILAAVQPLLDEKHREVVSLCQQRDRENHLRLKGINSRDLKITQLQADLVKRDDELEHMENACVKWNIDKIELKEDNNKLRERADKFEQGMADLWEVDDVKMKKQRTDLKLKQERIEKLEGELSARSKAMLLCSGACSHIFYNKT